MSSGFSARPVRIGVTRLARRDIPARDLSVIFVVEYITILVLREVRAQDLSVIMS